MRSAASYIAIGSEVGNVIISEIEGNIQLVGTFEHRAENVSRKDEGSLVTIGSDSSDDEALLLLPDRRSLTIYPSDINSRRALRELRSAAMTALCYIAKIRPSQIVLHANIFDSYIAFPQDAPLRILVTAATLEDIPKLLREKPKAFLDGQFLVGDAALAQVYVTGQRSDFHLISPKWICEVKIIAGRTAECVRLRQRRRQLRNQPIVLLRGDIGFTLDPTHDGSVAVMESQLRDTLANPRSYLKGWEIYNQLEERQRQLEALEIGSLPYRSVRVGSFGDQIEYIFQLTEGVTPAFRYGGMDLEAASKPLVENPETKQIEPPSPRVPVGEADASTPGSKQLITRVRAEPDSPAPPNQGYLIPSLQGDKVRLRRRERALNKVMNGEVPLRSTLGLLLESGDAPVQLHTHIAPMSAATRKAFGHPPTESQIAAMEVALNTPDIALIQGPPGTGKTTVIRALMTRLLELGEHRGEQASILVSSYQHDAVDNVITGADVGGLPPNRVGGRRGSSQEAREQGLWDWVRDRQLECNRVLESLPSSSMREVARSVDRLIDQWRRVRGGSSGAALLTKEICDLVGPFLRAEQLVELRALTSEIESEVMHRPGSGNHDERSELAEMGSILSAQRLEASSFLDDGTLQARRLLRYLERISDVIDVAIPEQVRRATHSSLEDAEEEELVAFLTDYAQALSQMLSDLPGQGSAPEGSSDTVVRLDRCLSEVSHALHARWRNSADSVADIVTEFRDELDDPREVKKLVDRYSAVVAGTCQQVAPQSYRLSEPERRYDYVIIDEAARANPLDLLIPMSLGQKIVLVGDHRQLPHVLEQTVVDAFQGDLDEQVGNFLSESLFERLFRTLDASYSKGGPRRTVTLLDDFRMHPVIGEFVSSTFYGGQVKPRSSVVERSHGLDIYGGRPVCWLDVPRSSGLEAPGQSKMRPAEVKVIAEEAERVLRLHPTYRIGLITFYSKQAELLQLEIDKLPVDWKNRVLVGTVDAFQGREFDITFLSTVRSNNQNGPLRSRVGFLALPNRMCVALSRAKRALIVVGDAETVAGTRQSPVVKELQAFYELCLSTEGWHEQRH